MEPTIDIMVPATMVAPVVKLRENNTLSHMRHQQRVKEYP